MPEVIIRQAQNHDIERMCDLLEQLYAIEADFSFEREKQIQGLTLLLQEYSRSRIFVAEINQHVIAMCSVQLVISTAEGGLSAWLEDVVVDAAHRQTGVAIELLASVEQWCRDHRILRIQLLADEHNHLAQKFYTQGQWQPTQLRAWRKILS